MQVDEHHKCALNVAIKSAIHLQLQPDSICTACQYLHRFYRYINDLKNNSQQDIGYYDPGIVVATCLYIASKTNENNVRLSELISSVHYHFKLEKQKISPNYENYQLLTKDVNYWKLRDSVVQFELLMLRILKFNLTIDLPHKYLIFYLKSLSDWIQNEQLMEEVFLLAWSLMNDYFCNHIESIKWASNQTALACIELAIRIISPNAKSLIENKQSNKMWYTNFDKSLKSDMINKIIDQILVICSSSQFGKNCNSTHLTTCDSIDAK